ncbi:hypothetical protein BDR04DRAFT_1151570 [Suillus decipiens]|nr:hypothetical protein BDR04DRAFT_1151570 [Suillus decipiens]
MATGRKTSSISQLQSLILSPPTTHTSIIIQLLTGHSQLLQMLQALTTRPIGGSATFKSWVKKQKFSHMCNIVKDSGKDVDLILNVQKHVITCFMGYLITLPTSQLSEIPFNHLDLAPGAPLLTLNSPI